MADLKALQKKLTTLLYTQLSQYFNQVKILSYKPSADGKVSGKFIGDRRNYSFILANNQLQYLPTTSQKMDSVAAITKSVNVQCTNSNHPCKGAKGTRCVPDSQSCKQRETSPEGLARIKEISDTSRQITALVAPNKNTLAKPNEKPSPDAPELDKDISLYDFLKYYSPWRPEGSKGFENAKQRVTTKRNTPKQTATNKQPTTQASNESKDPKTTQSAKSEPEAKVKEEPKKEQDNPYDFLGINPKDFPNEAALYKASKTAYRNLAAKYHPDKGGDLKLMTELNNVMDKLKRMRRDSLSSFARRRKL